MTKRKHTLEERVQVVRNWVKRYQEMSVAGLENRRGKCPASRTPRAAEEAPQLCRSLGIRFTIKYAGHGRTRRASDPQYLAENVLNRQFYADKPNEKWLTDVSEFKYYVGPSVHKLYLSPILDLCDRRIVSLPWSMRRWIKSLPPIRTHTPCFTATGVFSIPLGCSMTSWPQPG